MLEEIVVAGLVGLDARLERVASASPALSGRILQANRWHDDALAEYLAASVGATRADAPDLPPGVVTQVFVGMLDKGLDLAYRNDPHGDANILAEMARASIEYLSRFLV